MKSRISFLEKKVDDANIRATCVSENTDNLSSSVREALINVISTHFSRYGEKRVARDIADVVWSSTFFNGVVRDELLDREKDVIKSVFSAPNILCEMDLSSSSLNLSAIEILRKIEHLKKRQKA